MEQIIVLVVIVMVVLIVIAICCQLFRVAAILAIGTATAYLVFIVVWGDGYAYVDFVASYLPQNYCNVFTFRD